MDAAVPQLPEVFYAKADLLYNKSVRLTSGQGCCRSQVPNPSQQSYPVPPPLSFSVPRSAQKGFVVVSDSKNRSVEYLPAAEGHV